MHHTRRLWPVLALWLAGCASDPPARLASTYPAEQAQIRQRLNEVIDAAQKKDFPRLESYHLYGPKFTKFSPEAPARLEAEAARRGERDGLSGAAGLTMRAEDVRIDVFGDVGIATFILDYGFQTATGPIEKQARSTLIFVNDRGQWRIAHEHLSALKSAP